jgi:hypothetical protein
MSDREDDARSTDGSDSEGSLVDFVLNSDDEEEDAHGGGGDEGTVDLVKEFPFDARLLEERDATGPRRSRRAKKVPVRYIDPNYAKLMLDDVSDLEEEEEEEEIAEAEDDQSFHCDSDESESSDEEDGPPLKKAKTTEDNGEPVIVVLV